MKLSGGSQPSHQVAPPSSGANISVLSADITQAYHRQAPGRLIAKNAKDLRLGLIPQCILPFCPVGRRTNSILRRLVPRGDSFAAWYTSTGRRLLATLRFQKSLSEHNDQAASSSGQGRTKKV